MAAHYTHDHAAFGELVLKAAFMRADLQARADRVKALAEETAPYDPKDAPPHFRDSFHAEVVDRGDRLIAHVYNDAPDALYAEFGNGHAGTAHHTLFNALRAAK